MSETAERTIADVPEFIATVALNGDLIHAVRRSDEVLARFARVFEALGSDARVVLHRSLCTNARILGANLGGVQAEWDFTKHENVVTVSRKGGTRVNTVCPACTRRVGGILRARASQDGTVS